MRASRTLLALTWALGCRLPPTLPDAELPAEGAFTIVVMPDTQGYVRDYRYDQALTAQTRWVAQAAEAHDIRYVLHLGDIVEHNNTTEWSIVRGLFEPLHQGDRVRVPYALAPGNHDFGADGKARSRWTLMNRDEYFGPSSPYGRQPTIGGFLDPGSTANTWHEFEARGRKWMILALEFGPSGEVIEWANEVVQAHPEHDVIVITHAYLSSSNARYHRVPYGGTQRHAPPGYPLARDEDVRDGQAMWEELVSRHANIRMVLCGHALSDGEARMTTVGERGQVVHQLLQNYQPGVEESEFGGNGFIRLMEFQPDDQTVVIRTWSPFLGEYVDDPAHDFSLSLSRRDVREPYAQRIATAGPLLHYRPRLDEGTAVTNRGAGGAAFDGTYEGDGDRPSAFDGDAAIRTTAPLPRLEAWSIEAWVLPELSSSRQVVFTNDQPFDGERGDSEGSHDGGSHDDAGPSRFHDDVLFGIAPEGSNVSDEERWAIVHRRADGERTVAVSSQPTLRQRWSHVVATSDGARLRLFVNGERVAEQEAEGPGLPLGGGVPALLGRSDHVVGAALYGQLGELALYDRALSSAEVVEHHMSAFSRVIAARYEMVGAVNPDAQELEDAEMLDQGLPGLTLTQANRGDVQLFLGAAQRGDPSTSFAGATPVMIGDGVMMASVTQNMRTGVVGAASVDWNARGTGIVTVSITQVGAAEEPEDPPEEEDEEEIPEDDPEDDGSDAPSVQEVYDVEPTVLNEVNLDGAVAWFPFGGGWRGGHATADGTLFAGQGVSPAQVRLAPDTTRDDGRLHVDLGVDPFVHGLLFAIEAGGKNRVAVAGPRPDGGGWELRLQPNSIRKEGFERPTLDEVFDELGLSPAQREEIREEDVLTLDTASFVYVPFDSPGLVGGMYDGRSNTPGPSVGEFTMTKLHQPGAYRLELEGTSAQEGMLMLTGADLDDPRNVALTYEAEEDGTFSIRAWEVQTAEPHDTTFCWAFVSFNEPLRPPG